MDVEIEDHAGDCVVCGKDGDAGAGEDGEMLCRACARYIEQRPLRDYAAIQDAFYNRERP